MESAIGFSLVIILINIILKKKIDKEYQDTIIKKMEYNYWRDVEFENITPVEAGILSDKENICVNTFITILFELEKKDILKIENIDNKYYISLKCNDINKINGLYQYESKIVKLIFKGTKDNTKKELSEIISIISGDLSKKTYLDSIYKEIKNGILEKYSTAYTLYGKNVIFRATIMFMLFVGIFNIISNSFLFSQVTQELMDTALQGQVIIINIISVLMCILQLFLFVKLIKSKYVKNEYIDEVAKLKGLYNYLTDFSIIKEKGINHYELYEEYYLYAVSMGIADKFESELGQNKIPSEIETNLNFLLAYNNIMKKVQSKEYEDKETEEKPKKSIKIKLSKIIPIICFLIPLFIVSIMGLQMINNNLLYGILLQLPLIFVLSIVIFLVTYTRKQKIVEKVQRKIDRWK